MGNKKIEKRPIIRDNFLRIIREKGYTVERLGMQPQVNRSGKTIQRCLVTGEMPPELLNRIARFLDVDPSYLAGDYDRRFEDIKDMLVGPLFMKNNKTEKILKFEYKKRPRAHRDYILSVLRFNNISIERYLALDLKKRNSLNVDLNRAVTSVIKQYFAVDSCNIEIDTMRDN